MNDTIVFPSYRHSFATLATLTALGLILLGMLQPARISASDKIDPEKAAAVQAAYLYNFAKFVTWPTKRISNSSPFVIGVMGKTKAAGVLKKLARTKKAKGRSVVIKELKFDEKQKSTPGLADCHILYIAESEKKAHEKIFKQIGTQHILSVSTASKFCEQGGCVELKLTKGKYKLRINNESAKKKSLKVSSKLLRLAEIVKSEKIEKDRD